MSELVLSRPKMAVTSSLAVNFLFLPALSSSYFCKEGSLLQGLLQKGQFYVKQHKYLIFLEPFHETMPMKNMFTECNPHFAIGID